MLQGTEIEPNYIFGEKGRPVLLPLEVLTYELFRNIREYDNRLKYDNHQSPTADTIG